MLIEDISLSIVVLLGFTVMLYLVLIRPQLKRCKKHEKLLSTLEKGDEVVTMGGIIGTIVSLDEPDEVVIEVSEGNQLRVIRSMVEKRLAQKKAN